MNVNSCAMVLIGVLGITPVCFADTSSDKTSMQEVKQETEDLLQTFKAYTVDQKEEAIRSTNAALHNLDKRIDALETEVDESWETMNRDVRKKARDSLKSMRKQRIQVAQWYGRLQESTGNAWEQMKDGFSDAYERLHEAWEKSEREFGFNS